MTDEDRYFGFLVSDVSRLLRTAFDRRVRNLGLTRSQWMVLTRLGRRPGASQSELADMMEMERATAGRLIDRLEENGWVRREADSADRRVKRIFPTEDASAIQRQMRVLAESVVADALADISEREQDVLADLLLIVKGRLQHMLQDDFDADDALDTGASAP